MFPTHIPYYKNKKKKNYLCACYNFFLIHIFVFKINGSADPCLQCSRNTKNMDIYALVCFVYPLTVKILNSMLKDYVCQGLCVLD